MEYSEFKNIVYGGCARTVINFGYDKEALRRYLYGVISAYWDMIVAVDEPSKALELVLALHKDFDKWAFGY